MPRRKYAPRFTIKHHLLRYASSSSLRRTSLYASLVGTSQALHLMLAGESVKYLTGKFYMTNRNLMVDLGCTRQQAVSRGQKRKSIAHGAWSIEKSKR